MVRVRLSKRGHDKRHHPVEEGVWDLLELGPKAHDYLHSLDYLWHLCQRPPAVGLVSETGRLYFTHRFRRHPVLPSHCELTAIVVSWIFLMELVVVGLNHRSAPIEIREQVAFADNEVLEILNSVREEKRLLESMLVSTCNRTEFYGISTNEDEANLYIRELLSRFKTVNLSSNNSYAYTLTRTESIRHLFRVAAGLDSMVLGEPQILGQVRQAHELAIKAQASGLVLNKMLQSAMATGRRIRNETQIGAGAISVASAAAELAGKIFDDLSKRSVLLIGVGEMGALTARHMLDRGVRKLTIANRTYHKAEELADSMGGQARSLDQIENTMESVDIVISSTGAAQPLVRKEQMRQILSQRSGRPLYVIDIAVPRDFDQSIGKLDGIFLHDIDDMNLLVNRNLNERREEIPQAEAIIEQQLEVFLTWRRSLAAAPAIKKLREHIRELRVREVSRHAKRFCSEDQNQLDRLTESILNKILHPMMANVRDWNEDSPLGAIRIDTLYEAFGLEREPSDVTPEPKAEPAFKPTRHKTQAQR